MERIIKFRAWDDHHKEMITPYCELKDTRFWGFDLTNNPFSPSVVMQYTGLKDKSGREIYEGDVIRFNYSEHEERVGVVRFGSGAFHIGIIVSLYETQISANRIMGESLEVIGNIHANPELIKS